MSEPANKGQLIEEPLLKLSRIVSAEALYLTLENYWDLIFKFGDPEVKP